MNMKIKPCYYLKYCPYGTLVEYYPIESSKDSYKDGFLYNWNDGKLVKVKHRKEATRCKCFGHDCPVYYQAESFVDYLTEEERRKVIVTEEL